MGSTAEIGTVHVLEVMRILERITVYNRAAKQQDFKKEAEYSSITNKPYIALYIPQHCIITGLRCSLSFLSLLAIYQCSSPVLR